MITGYDLVVDTLSDEAVDQGLSPCFLCHLRDTAECSTVGIPKCTDDPERQYIRLVKLNP